MFERLDDPDPPLVTADVRHTVARRAGRLRFRRRVLSSSAFVGVAALAVSVSLVFAGGQPDRVSRLRVIGGPSPASVAPVALGRPGPLALGSDGSVLVADSGRNEILRLVSSTGELQVIAGDGRAGYAGDGEPATAAELSQPRGMAVAPDGSIYVADTANNRIRRIGPDGIITTVAGDGIAGSSGDGGPAVAAELRSPQSVALEPGGELDVADSGNGRIQIVSTNGTISTAAFHLIAPSALAVTSSGDLYIADLGPRAIYYLPAHTLVLKRLDGDLYVPPGGLAVAPDGSVIAANYSGLALSRITPLGHEALSALQGITTLPGVGPNFRPSGVAVGPDGTIYVSTNGVNGGEGESAIIAVSPIGAVRVLATNASSAVQPSTPSGIGAPTTSSPTGGQTAAGPANPAAADSQVRAAYLAFFSSTTPDSQRFKYIQGSDAGLMQAVREAAARNPDLQGHVSVRVDQVTFTSPTEAQVTYDLILPASSLYATSTASLSGLALLDNGAWKVARSTECGNLELGGVTCPP